MFVRLGDTVWEIEMAAVQPVTEWQLDEILVREQSLHFPSECFIHSVIVICVQKSPVHEV